MKARKNRGTEEQFLKEELLQAALKLELAELGAMVPRQSLPYEEQFALLLKCVRQFRGLSKAQLAKRSNVREETISRLERAEHRPQARTIIDLARALEVSPEFLQPERVFSEWPDYPAAVRKRLSGLRALDIQATRENRAAIDQEKAGA